MRVYLYTCLLLVCFAYIAQAEKQMFDVCDTNGDKKISPTELAVCMNVIPENEDSEFESLRNKVANLMKLFDNNNDGSISVSEFKKATEKANEAFELDEFIDVTRADGTIKKIHKSELFNNVKDSSNGFEMRNDKIYKEESKNGDIKELSEKDPALGNMIRIGQWAARELNMLNITTGRLLNMESLPNGGSVVSKERLEKEPELLGVKFNGPFEVWLKMKVGSTAGPALNVTILEVHMGYDKEKYKPPFLALLDVWVLATSDTDSGATSGVKKSSAGAVDVRAAKLELPPPPLRDGFSSFIVSEFKSYTSLPYANVVVAVFIGLLILTVVL